MLYASSIIERRNIAEGTLEITLKRPQGYVFQSGHHAFMSVPSQVPEDTRGGGRYFSLVSAPGAETLSFVTRIGNSAFKKYLSDAPLGAPLFIEEAKGKLFIPHPLSEPIVCIAGGIGLAPFVSIIRDMVSKKDTYPHVFLFSSHRSTASAIYHQELTDFSQTYPWFTFIPTITGSQEESWEGATGRIDFPLLVRTLSDTTPAHFYIAGSEPFNASMKKMLVSAGVSSTCITSEDFCGYQGFWCAHCSTRYQNTV